MIITVKTLQNKKYELTIADTDTVADIKHKIHAELSLGEPDTQKLIYHGKILKDEQTAADVGFKEKDFLVVMVRKAKKPKPKPRAEAAPAVAASGSGSSAAAPAAASPASGSGAAAAASGGNAAAAASGSSSLVTGPEYEAAVARLMGMGFENAQVRQAMRAAFNNPDRAVEYLINGIPEGAAPPAAAPPAAAAAAGGGGGGGGAPPAAGAGAGGAGADGGAAAALRGLPAGLQGNPEMVLGLIGNLARTNPQLMAAIQQNPDALRQALENPQMLQQLMSMMLLQQMQQGGGGGGAAAGGGGDGPRPGMIQVSPEEKAAIDRLVAFGFPEAAAVEAYMVCGKNEELAANYLFENQQEMGGMPFGAGGAGGAPPPAGGADGGGGDGGAPSGSSPPDAAGSGDSGGDAPAS